MSSNNLLTNKLIHVHVVKSQEMNDVHEECNVDIQFAAFRGVSVKLCQGLRTY